MKMGAITAEFAEKILKSCQYAAKGSEVKEIAKKLGIKVERLQNKDLEKARKILSKGEPLSEIVRQHRKA